MAKVNGNGTIEQRSKGVWLVRLHLGIDPVTGKERRPSRTVRGTKAEARRVLNEWIHDIENGLKTDADKITFAEYARAWHEERAAMGIITSSTLDVDARVIKKAIEYIGDAKLAELDVATLRSLYAKMRESGASGHFVHSVHTKTKQILRSAVDDDIILRNPCDRLSVPRPKPEQKRESLTKREAARLLRVLDSAGDESACIVAVRIGLATGMRRGEVMGLMWKHVDFERGSIEVAQQYTKDRSVRAPKTESGKRIIAVDATTLKHLSEWKKIQADYLHSLWVRQKPETPVVTDDCGGLHDPDNFSRWFQLFCARNGFARYVDDAGKTIPMRWDEDGWPVDEEGRRYSRSNRRSYDAGKMHYRGLKFHELRHTQATLLIADGVDIKTVQERLGHARVSLTLDLYAHATPEKDRAAADLIGSILNETPPAPDKIVNL